MSKRNKAIEKADKKDRHALQRKVQGQVTSEMVYEALVAASGHARTYEAVASRYSLPKEAAYSTLDSWARKGWVTMKLATVNGKQRRVFALTSKGRTAFAELARPKVEELQAA